MENLSVLFTSFGSRREGGDNGSRFCFVRQILGFDIQNLAIREAKKEKQNPSEVRWNNLKNSAFSREYYKLPAWLFHFLIFASL